MPHDARHGRADAAPDPAVARVPRRPVRAGHRRDRRRAPHAVLLAELLAVPRGRAVRAHRQGAPGRACSRSGCTRTRVPASCSDLGQADGTFTPAGHPSRADAARQRGQRHHAGAVDAAHAVRRGPSRRGRVPALRGRRGRTSRIAPNSSALAAAHDNVRVVLAYTATDDGDLTGFFGAEHLEAVAPWHATARPSCAGRPD